MKKTILLLALTVSLVFIVNANAQMGGWNTGGWYCPYCGGQNMGPGMQGQQWGGGWGMGPGMMNRGWGSQYGPQYNPQYNPQVGPQSGQPSRQMEEADARTILENYLTSTRNPNLKLGKIEDKGSVFEAEILTKDDSMVDKIMVDKNTGWIRSAY